MCAGAPWVGTFGDAAEPQVRPLDIGGTQFEIYRRIAASSPQSFLFESLSGPETLAETSIIGFDPDETITGYADRLVIEGRDGSSRTVRTDDPVAELRRVLPRAPQGRHRYLGGAVGIVEYEAAGLWEARAPLERDAPLMEFGVYSDGILFDSSEGRPYYFFTGEDRSASIVRAEPARGQFSHSGLRAEPDAAGFERAVEEAREHVRAGDIFQAVLSRRFGFEYGGDPMRVYERLRELNPSPYLYHMKMRNRTIMGASPEMLVRVTGRRVETFPIAGTRPITGDAARDAALGEEMAGDEKEVAEHVMLVDLGRNDIGRVCEPGSVRAEDLMSVRRFSHVQHMVTHVTGTLRGDLDAIDAFGAVFPAGTVTGAPKVRAMEIISSLERARRGGYAGAVGYFASGGSCDFAIAIRSMFLEGGRGYVQAGAGIVYDSVPESELRETEHKAGALLTALKEASA